MWTGSGYAYDGLAVVVDATCFSSLPSSCFLSILDRLDVLATVNTTSIIGREQIREIPDEIQGVIEIHNLFPLGFIGFQQCIQNRREQTSLTRLQKHGQLTFVSSNGTKNACPV